MAAAVAVLAGLALAVVPGPPAGADHSGSGTGNQPPHWEGTYRPWVSTPNPNLWAYTGAAEWRWTVNGFSRGFVTGSAAPAVGCPAPSPPSPYPHVVGNNVWWSGGIVSCVSDWIDPDFDRCGTGCRNRVGVALRTSLAPVGQPWHLAGVLIKVCFNCGLSDQQLNILWAHEYGHAVGLGHTALATPANPCVMWPRVDEAQAGLTPCSHDRWAVLDTYNHWSDGP